MPESELSSQIARFLEELKRNNVSPHTLGAYGSDLAQFLEYFSPPGTDPPGPREFEVWKIREWLGSLYQQKLTAVSMRRKLAALRAFFRFLGREGFRHNEQSVRIVEKIEKNGAGLNLTHEVRDGIAKHSAPTEGGVETAAWGIPETPEGWIVRYADKIAYLHHDIDDAMRAGIITEADLPPDLRAALGSDRAERLDTMIYDVIVTSYGKPDVTMSAAVLEATNALRKFMFDNVYLSGPAKTEDEKAQGVLWELLQYFEAHPERMPAEHQRIAAQENTKRAVADYIAGMTDTYALDTFTSLFIPAAWSHL